MLFLSFTAEQDKPLTESLYSVYDSRSFIHCGDKRTTKFMPPMALYYEVAPLLWLRYNAFYISSEEKLSDVSFQIPLRPLKQLM